MKNIQTTAPKKKGIFYGWWIVAVAFLCMFVNGGAGYYAFSLFYKPLETEFAWTRAEISAAFTVYFLTQGIAAPFIGRLFDRFGARIPVALGALVTGLGFASLSLMQNIWLYYMGYLVIGLGMTALGAVGTTHMVTRWFTGSRGTMVGIMATGIGFGALIISSIWGAYLVPGLGWRTGYLALALLAWIVIIPAALIVIRERPKDTVLIAEKDVATTATPALPSERWTLGKAAGTLTFWLIAIGFFTTSMGHTSAIQHQVNYITDIGFPVATASLALGFTGFFSGAGKFIFGWLCDRIQARHSAALCFTMQLAAVIMLLMLRSSSPGWIIFVYAFIMGVGSGGWLPNKSMLVTTSYGLSAYGAIFGALSFTTFASTGLGPLVAGRMFDVMGDYNGVFYLLILLYIIGIPAILFTRREKLKAPMVKPAAG